jgi:hypothetical protein
MGIGSTDKILGASFPFVDPVALDSIYIGGKNPSSSDKKGVINMSAPSSSSSSANVGSNNANTAVTSTASAPTLVATSSIPAPGTIPLGAIVGISAHKLQRKQR